MKTQGNQKLNKNNFKKYLQKKKKRNIFSGYDCFNLKGWLQTKKQKNIVTPLLKFL